MSVEAVMRRTCRADLWVVSLVGKMAVSEVQEAKISTQVVVICKIKHALGLHGKGVMNMRFSTLVNAIICHI